MNEKAHETIARQGDFPTDTSGLPRAVAPSVVELADGDTTELHIGPVVKRIGDSDVRMLAYNGSVPGPTFKISEGASVTVDARTRATSTQRCTGAGGGEPLRRDSDTQAPIPVEEHLPAAGPRSRRVLVPPSHPRGLWPGDGPVRQHPRRPRRAGVLATRPPRAVPDAGRRSHRRRKDRQFQRLGDDTCSDGPLRQRNARGGRARPGAHRWARRGRAFLPSPTLPTLACST